MKLPTLKTTKWKEMNSRGWISGVVEIISIVMEGKTDYVVAISTCVKIQQSPLTSVTVKTYAIATS